MNDKQLIEIEKDRKRIGVKEKKKVYCIDCKYFKRYYRYMGTMMEQYPIQIGINFRDIETEDYCNHSNAKIEKDTYYTKEETSIHPSERNINNDCPDFEEIEA